MNDATIFPIGTKFLSDKKHGLVRTVVDIYKTYNSAGDLVKIRYAASHVFMEQTIVDHDVLFTTIAKRLV